MAIQLGHNLLLSLLLICLLWMAPAISTATILVLMGLRMTGVGWQVGNAIGWAMVSQGACTRLLDWWVLVLSLGQSVAWTVCA